MGDTGCGNWRVAGLAWLVAGCVSVEAPHPVISPAAAPPAVAVTPVGASAQPPAAAESGEIRLALADLAIMLDTLNRLDQLRPELKSQMLAELAEADSTAAAAVVKSWRDRLDDFERVSDGVRSAASEHPAAQFRTESGPSQSPPNAPVVVLHPTPSGQPDATEQPLDAPTDATALTAGESSAPEPAALSSPARRAVEVSESGRAVNEDSARAAVPPRWDELLDALNSQARERAGGTGRDAQLAGVQLELLELVELCEFAGAGAAENAAFWRRLGSAFDSMLAAGSPVHPADQPAALAVLETAAGRLRAPARLEVRHLAFCTRVRGYGNIEPLRAPALAPGQPVLLYSEVENLHHEPLADGFRTRLSSELAVLDAQRRPIWQQQFAAVEDRSSVPRRDYFLSHTFRLPTQLPPGTYSVELTLRDELAGRSTTSSISFAVR
jgi:hypothetical protein